MASYGELKADVASWVIGEDISATVPSLIRLAEQRHKYGAIAEPGRRADYGGAIRVRDMERKARSNGNDSIYLAMPTGALEHKTLSPVADGVVGAPFQFLGVQEFANQVRMPSGTVIDFYTIERNEFRLSGALGTGDEVECLYYAPYDPLVNDSDTNWLLDNAYGAYLFGALAEAEVFTQDDARSGLWEAKYAALVKALNKTERAAQRSHAAVTVKPLRMMP